MRPMMSSAQRVVSPAEHRSGALLTVLTMLLITGLMSLAQRVEAIPFVGADFQRFDGLSLTGRGQSQAKVHKVKKSRKVRKQRGKVTKKATLHGPTHSRRGSFARAWAHNGDSDWTSSAAMTWLSSSAGNISGFWFSDVNELTLGAQDILPRGNEIDVSDEPSDESPGGVLPDEMTVGAIPVPELIELASEFVSANDVPVSEDIITQFDNHLPSLVTSEPEIGGLAPPPAAQRRAPGAVSEPNSALLVALALITGCCLPRRLQRARRRI